MSVLPFRHELKYDIHHADYLALRSRLCHVMQPDAHVHTDGKYCIHSLYFDNGADKALREKVNGYAQREKYRIRWYNDDLSYIALEKKQKINGLTLKLSAIWTEAELRRLLAGDNTWMLAHPAPLTRELAFQMKAQLLRPRVLVTYTREPFIYRAGNVRVTFDSGIRSSLDSRSFLAPAATIDVAENPDHVILEVKYDAFLPSVIACLLQMDDCRQTAYSKYCACRRFGTSII